MWRWRATPYDYNPFDEPEYQWWWDEQARDIQSHQPQPIDATIATAIAPLEIEAPIDINMTRPVREEKWASMAPIGFGKYMVSDKGNIRSHRGYVLSPYPHPCGHLYIGLENDQNQRRSRFVHALVAAMFLPPPADSSYKWILHRNKDPNDCWVENLVRANVQDTANARGPQKQHTHYRAVDAMRDGIVIKTYKSALEASKELRCTDSGIRSAICEGHGSYFGFMWRYTPEPDLDGEEWRPIPGYPGTVSNLGRYRNARGYIREGTVTMAGYRTINFSNTDHIKLGSVRLHVLVCRAFHGECPPGMTVDHIDQKKLNNAASNLRYATPSQQAFNRTNKRSVGGRKVYQFTLDGIYIQRHDSLVDAAAAVPGTLAVAIGHCCRGASMTCAGYVWSYQAPDNDRAPEIN